MAKRTDSPRPHERPRYEVRDKRDPYGGTGWGIYDTATGEYIGYWFAGHMRDAAEYTASHLEQP